MRSIEALLFAAALSLACPLAAAAALPTLRPSPACRPGPLVLAQRGAGRLGSDPAYELKVPFTLAAPQRVWAEVQGLGGLREEDRDAAPEAFIDDSYLGPLRLEHGRDWRSPEALSLSPGAHTFLLRCARSLNAATPRWKGVQVLGETQCPPGTGAARPGAGYAAKGCKGLVRRRDWPAKLKGGVLVLSVLSGRLAMSGLLVRLNEGESWEARLRIPMGKNGKPLPLRAGFDLREKTLVRMVLLVDDETNGPVDALGYTPGEWEPLKASFCNGALRVQMGRVPEMAFPWKGRTAGLEVATQDLELSLKPAPR